MLESDKILIYNTQQIDMTIDTIQSMKTFTPISFHYCTIDNQSGKICIKLKDNILNYNIDDNYFINISEKNKDKILSINTEADLNTFNTTYTTGNDLHTGICWNIVAEDYAGIEIRQEFTELREEYKWFQSFIIKGGYIWNSTIFNYMVLE